MNKLRKFIMVAAAALIATSCMTVKLSSMKDEELVKAGVDAWNTKKPEEARPYWEAIRDQATKEKYLSAYEKVAELDALHQSTVAVEPDQDAKQEEAFKNFAAKYHAFPKELNMGGEYKPSLRPLTVNVVRARVKSRKFDSAKAFIKDAVAFLGESAEYDTYENEMDAYARVQDLEKKADKTYADAKAVEEFHSKITAYEGSLAAYRKAETSSAAEIKKLSAANDFPLSGQNAKLKKKRGIVRIEMERLIRERGTSFKERIGEEFARVPENSRVGNMGSEDILKFNEEIRANIETQYKDIIAFSEKYPAIIDKDMIRDIDGQKKSLDDRITTIAAEVRRAKDIASRGKAAMPLLIGLFNPVPASKTEGAKSRPAILRGKITKDADYWWGMVSIESGKMNDLVITMKDGKEIQVYAENTLSGTRIKKKKLTNLVSSGSKIGNSWPVLNAGTALNNGQYYLRISENGNPAYSGDVVVYSSFISRMR